jgi:branched-chain amino acid aminotransferase
MDKCTNKYFIVNDQVTKCEEFKNCDTSKGKCLYEVIRVSEGIPIFLMEHLERLENSAQIMSCKLFITRDEIINAILILIHKNSVLEGNIKLVINYDPNASENEKGSTFDEKFLAYFLQHKYPSKLQYTEGVETITYKGERKSPNAKVIDNDFREKVNQKIISSGVYEAILVDDYGFITEGSKSNIFMVQGSIVITSKIEKVLPGITRQFIIKVCAKLNIEFQEKNIREKDLKALTGLFISGTSPKVLPIKSVDDLPYNSSTNSVINSIMLGFENEINEDKQKFVKFTESITINK